MKKTISVLFLVMLLISMLCSCSNDSEEGNAKPSDSSQLNIYKDEYEEKYSNYEDDIIVEDNSQKIVVHGTSSSGDIDVTVVATDESNKETDFEYKIESSLNETIELADYPNCSWKIQIHIDENTEGSISYDIY